MVQKPLLPSSLQLLANAMPLGCLSVGRRPRGCTAVAGGFSSRDPTARKARLDGSPCPALPSLPHPRTRRNSQVCALPAGEAGIKSFQSDCATHLPKRPYKWEASRTCQLAPGISSATDSVYTSQGGEVAFYHPHFPAVLKIPLLAQPTEQAGNSPRTREPLKPFSSTQLLLPAQPITHTPQTGLAGLQQTLLLFSNLQLSP